MKKGFKFKCSMITSIAVLLVPSYLSLSQINVVAQSTDQPVEYSESNDSLVRLEQYIIDTDIESDKTDILPADSVDSIFGLEGNLFNGTWTFEIISKENGDFYVTDSLGNTVVYQILVDEPLEIAFEHASDNSSYSFYFVSQENIDHLIYDLTSLALDVPETSEEGLEMEEPEELKEEIDGNIVNEEVEDIESLEEATETETVPESRLESLDDYDKTNVELNEPAPEVEIAEGINGNGMKFQVKTSSIVQNATRYYIVNAGETLAGIASKLGLSVQNLQTWNKLSNNTIVTGQVLSINGINVYDRVDEENRNFSSKNEFVQYMSSRAKSVAHEQGKEQLYASVMIAQASLESDYGTSTLAQNGNNLFGMKGSYNGYSIVKRTWEHINGVNTYVDADFKFYPNFSSSLNDNASRLRNGVSWDKNYYNGTWVRRTSSFRDATKWLTGRYATDPNYNNKLNTIINTYNLLQYDLDTVDVNYEAEILQRSFSIDSLPWGSTDTRNVGNTTELYGRKVRVIRENQNRAYALIQLDGEDYGWVDKRAFELVLSKPVNYEAVIVSPNHSIDSLPWGTKGYIKQYSSNEFINGQILEVTEETTNGAYAKISQNGAIKGWIDKKAIIGFDSVKVSYKVKINYSGHSIDSLPWGTAGYKNIASSSDYLGTSLDVVREAKDGNYLLLSNNGKALGWVDKRAIESFETKSISYSDTIKHGNYSIDTRPWGYSGYERKESSSKYIGNTVEIMRETTNGSYAFIVKNGRELGWIDKRAFDRKQVNYQSVISNPRFSIDSLPWGEKGYRVLGNSSNYINQNITVIAESNNGAYVLIILKGKALGWVDKRAIETFGTEAITYKETIRESNYSIDSKPWGYNGFKNISSSSILVGKEVHILRETANGAYAYIELDGKAVGWVDKRTFGRNPVSPNQYAVINSGYSIDSLPWGERGSIKIGDSMNYVGQSVRIVLKSKNNAYGLVILNNKELGWIDMRALKAN
ncbi:GW dipeptide domain-containing protein [Marinilactibacillus sp. XAAS-LB27]|uniref:GW dipeptide domain-containing protein n=1 Tax=Marinilactibacillus sp. XAAS-LB27 TaxID=3114538 RepID=UPI002E17F6A2|nr:GW dipeptide domain-containing protein [Marinilactibacillus sp. XAAS-LB27]